MWQEGFCLPAAAFFFVCLVGVHAALYTKKKKSTAHGGCNRKASKEQRIGVFPVKRRKCAEMGGILVTVLGTPL